MSTMNSSKVAVVDTGSGSGGRIHSQNNHGKDGLPRPRKNVDTAMEKSIPLVLNKRLDCVAFGNALAANSMFNHVDAYMYKSFHRHSGQDILHFFHGMGSMPKLKSASFFSSAGSFERLPVDALRVFLEQAQGLAVLSLHFLQLDGAESSFFRLGKALQHHSSLQRIYISGTHIIGDDINNSQSSAFDYLMRSLSKLATLEVVDISHHEQQQRNLGAKTLAALCQSPSLRKLYLNDILLEDGHVLKLASSLATNTTMKEIEICCKMGKQGSNALAQMVQRNKTLKRFIVQLVDTTDDGMSDECTIEISNAMLVNAGIKDFEMKPVSFLPRTTARLYDTTGSIRKRDA